MKELINMKKCSKCGEVLPRNEEYFQRRKQSKDGYRGVCRKCTNKARNNLYHSNNTSRNILELKTKDIKEYNKKYYQTNKEKIKENNKKYYENNRYSTLKRKKQYYEENKEKILINSKSYREANREKIKLSNKRWNEEKGKEYRDKNRERLRQDARIRYNIDKERIRRVKREYRNKNKAKFKFLDKIQNTKRKCRIRQSGGTFTTSQWQDCLSFFNNQCAYTGEPLTDVHIEHIIPVSKGGTSYIWNICPSCPSANLSKYNKDLEEWYKEQEYYSEERLNKIYEWIEYSKNKYKKCC